MSNPANGQYDPGDSVSYGCTPGLFENLPAAVDVGILRPNLIPLLYAGVLCEDHDLADGPNDFTSLSPGDSLGSDASVLIGPGTIYDQLYSFPGWGVSISLDLAYTIVYSDGIFGGVDPFLAPSFTRENADITITIPISAWAVDFRAYALHMFYLGKIPYYADPDVYDLVTGTYITFTDNGTGVAGYRYFVKALEFGTPAAYVAAHWAIENASPLVLSQGDTTQMKVRLTPPLVETFTRVLRDAGSSIYFYGTFTCDLVSSPNPLTGPPFVPDSFPNNQAIAAANRSSFAGIPIDGFSVGRAKDGLIDEAVYPPPLGAYPPVPVGPLNKRYRVEYFTDTELGAPLGFGPGRVIYDDGPQYLDVTVLPIGGGGPPPPPSNLTLVKRLIVPVMDADSVTGRVALSLGMVDYEQLWSVSEVVPKTTSGAFVAQRVGLGKVTGHPVLYMEGTGQKPGLTDTGAPTGLVWETGQSIGLTPAEGHYILPQSLFSLAGEGIVRLCIQDTLLPPSSDTTTPPTSVRLWRESEDHGGSWADVTPAAGSAFPYAAYFIEGTGRGQRRVSGAVSLLPPLMPIVTDGGDAQPNNPRKVMEGAGAGFLYRQARWKGVSRMPPYAAYGGGAGAYAGISHPPAALFAPFIALSSTDGAGSFHLDSDSPVTGGFSPDYLAVPGYPFPPQDDPDMFGPLAGLPMQAIPLQAIRAPFCAAGAAVWARGADQAGSLYLFQPFIQRPPIAKQSFSWDGKTLTGGVDATGDPETSHSGRDWGTTTGIGWAQTGDSGETWSALGCITVGGSPLIVDAETVRIAAARVSAGRLLLCVCASGIATLYVSDNGAQDFTALEHSLDGGATWQTTT